MNNTASTITTSSREFRDEIVGKRISAVVARPGRNGQPPVVLMLHFEDGSSVEFVSPRSDKLLKSSLQACAAAGDVASASPQLELVPLNAVSPSAHGLN
ncbi:MAG: hypothetical protein ACXIUB_08800 [Wenzhouxiangella sp.]